MKTLATLVTVCVLILGMSHNASAAIRRVGLNQTYTTLTAAYTAAVNDDTLLISPGVYSETITSTKRLTWLGSGYDEAIINGRLILNAGSSGTRVEGLQIVTTTSNGTIDIAGGVDLVLIRRCAIFNNQSSRGNNAMGIRRSSAGGGQLSVDQCAIGIRTTYEYPYGGYTVGIESNGDNIVVRNGAICLRDNRGASATALAGSPSSVTLENCAILGFATCFAWVGAFPVVVKNCISHDWIGSGNWGTYPGGGTGWSYNASSTIAPPGTDGILLAGDPFVNYDETANYIYGSSDLHLAAGSPCIDAGDPAILDLDNSRSDMGIYGGPTPHVDGGAPNYPFAIDLTIPANMSAGQQLPIQATGRIGAGY